MHSKSMTRALARETTELSGELPTVMSPPRRSTPPVAWAAAHAGAIREKLTLHGAVLMRGLNVDGPADFDAIYRAILGPPLPYVERSSPRSSVINNVYTSTDYPADRAIFLHNEQSYNLVFSRYIGFYSQTTAETGGQTPLADVRRVLQRIDPAIRDELMARGYAYRRVYRSGLGSSWKEAYGTDDVQELERYFAANAIEHRWLRNGLLQTTQRRQVVACHPDSGQLAWFNHLTFFHHSTLEPELQELVEAVCPRGQYPHATLFGDDVEIPDDVVAHLRAAYVAEETTFEWEDGDILLVDNISTAHSRRPFEGPRRVLVAMSTPETWRKVGVRDAN